MRLNWDDAQRHIEGLHCMTELPSVAYGLLVQLNVAYGSFGFMETSVHLVCG